MEVESTLGFFALSNFLIVIPQIIMLCFACWLQYCIRKSREEYGENGVIRFKFKWKKVNE